MVAGTGGDENQTDDNYIEPSLSGTWIRCHEMWKILKHRHFNKKIGKSNNNHGLSKEEENDHDKLQ